MKRMRRSTGMPVLVQWLTKLIRDHYQTVLVVLGFFVLWEVLVRIFEVPEFILPTPSSAYPTCSCPNRMPIITGDYIFQRRLWVLDQLFNHKRGCSRPFIVMIWSKAIRQLLMPAFIFVNNLPIIAIAPIILLWMGYGLKTNILIAFLISFFPVVVNTVTGLEDIEDLLD